MDDLSQAQRVLSQTLGKARAGEDRELAQRVRENGEALGQMLAGLLKMTRVHAADHRAFDAPIAEFCRALSSLVDLLGTVHLVAVEDQAYLNEMRLRSEGRPGLRELGGELRRHNVGVSTVLAGWAVAVFAFATGADPARLTFAIAAALLLTYTHRSNLARLKAGTESRFDKVRLLHRLLARRG